MDALDAPARSVSGAVVPVVVDRAGRATKLSHLRPHDALIHSPSSSHAGRTLSIFDRWSIEANDGAASPRSSALM